jgi:hypothetical protein
MALRISFSRVMNKLVMDTAWPIDGSVLLSGQRAVNLVRDSNDSVNQALPRHAVADIG